MAVLPGNYFGDDYESFSSIGMLAQQNYNVGYDLNEVRLYFQRIDCELLDAISNTKVKLHLRNPTSFTLENVESFDKDDDLPVIDNSNPNIQ
ncbi:putative aspartic protease [Spatholobus suberectus]|nr:putative aspartic protease [Spatholobus suberectus]